MVKFNELSLGQKIIVITAIIGAFSVIIAALINFVGLIYQTDKPIKATQTAESATSTALQLQSLKPIQNSPTVSPTRLIDELSFVDIRIIDGDGVGTWVISDNWLIENFYPFEKKATYYYATFTETDVHPPCFDITVINMSQEPAIVTEIGVEFLNLAEQIGGCGGGVPRSFKIKTSDAYTITTPNFYDLFRSRLRQREIIELSRKIPYHLPDPVYMEPNAPFRFTLCLDQYIERAPGNAILAIYIKTNQSEFKSDKISLFYPQCSSR
jgi:hypothetical protein